MFYQLLEWIDSPVEVLMVAFEMVAFEEQSSTVHPIILDNWGEVSPPLQQVGSIYTLLMVFLNSSVSRNRKSRVLQTQKEYMVE